MRRKLFKYNFLRDKSRRQLHPPLLRDDVLFLERAERLMANAITERGCGAEEIVELFKKGYPIEELNRLFDDNDDLSTLLLGIEVCDELQKIAIPYIDRVAELMNQYELLTCYDFGVTWLANYADETNELADWIILSSLESKNISVAVITIRILSGIKFGQLCGAKAYLLKNIPNSPHIPCIDFFLTYYNDPQHILNALNDQNVLLQKYAVALASNFFTENNQIRDKALSLTNPAIELFVQAEIEYRERLLQIYNERCLPK
jgi:hypothetical protein